MADTSAPKKRDIVIIPLEHELPWLYSNATNVGWSIWDIRLTFAFAEAATEESLKLRQVAKIVMSPQHAKSLAGLLNSRLKIYEEKFGPLPDVSATIQE